MHTFLSTELEYYIAGTEVDEFLCRGSDLGGAGGGNLYQRWLSIVVRWR